MKVRSSLFLIVLFGGALSSVGCPSDDSGDEGASTSDSGNGDHAADSGSGTGHDHSVDTSADDPAVAYCSCMLANCHEPYHMKWGEDEMMAQAACVMEADALPMNGSDIDMGNFIECRMHFCELAATDPTVCTNALGDAVCM